MNALVLSRIMLRVSGFDCWSSQDFVIMDISLNCLCIKYIRACNTISTNAKIIIDKEISQVAHSILKSESRKKMTKKTKKKNMKKEK